MLFRGLAGLALVWAQTLAPAPGYTESLTLRPLPQHMLLSTFSFVAEQSEASERPSQEFTEYTTFPRSLGQILERASTHELHLRFAQGWWDAEAWGAIPANGSYAGGIGVEMWAWVAGASEQDARKNWHRLVHALSGYFCASLNFIDETVTTMPSDDILRPSSDSSEGLYLLRGVLPGEPVCTENLTPFLKLLPCKGRAGVASLLDGHSLFDSQWQSMSVDVDHHDGNVRLTQTIANVLDVRRMVRRRRDPLPRPEPAEDLVCDTSKPWHGDYVCLLQDPKSANWALSTIYGREIAGACPLADEGSKVYIEAPASWQSHLGGLSASGNASFSLPADSSDLTLTTENAADVLQAVTPPVYVDRSFTGWGQQRGGLRTVFTNPGNEDVDLLYLESLPWYMKLYLHTLEGDLDIVRSMAYTAAEDRKRPAQLELKITIPANSQRAIEYKFDKSLLYMEEYPPDANHGFEIAPALVRTSNGYTTRTTSLLLSLAVPDFSMPYNVIILTSTVMALTFGTLLNMLAMRVVPEALGEKLAATKPLGKLVARIRAVKAGIRSAIGFAIQSVSRR